MPSKPKLYKQMTIETFENNYWYALELKSFAKEIGIRSAGSLRKDELEKAIKQFLNDGSLYKAKTIKPRKAATTKDYAKAQLTPETLITNYTSDKTTKTFIQTEAKRRQPSLTKKSGAWYWLNRWREDQLAQHKTITYGDLVDQFMVLSNTKDRLPKIPSTKFNTFISDFLEAYAGSRADATLAWETLKTLDCPKNFKDWTKHKKP